MALCKHNCGTNLTWVKGADGKSKPYGPDGQPHRCAEGLAAWRAEQETLHGAPVTREDKQYTSRPAFSRDAVMLAEPRLTREDIVGPFTRSEVQELRHAVQRLARAVELLTEAVQALSERELSSS